VPETMPREGALQGEAEIFVLLACGMVSRSGKTEGFTQRHRGHRVGKSKEVKERGVAPARAQTLGLPAQGKTVVSVVR
jgi:hypothetical protein